jgi:DNA-binding NarL/FixJ family response regulator
VSAPNYLTDDHPIVLHGVAEILRAQSDINVVATCSTGRTAVVAIQQLGPDVAVLDLVMSDLNGLDILGRIAGKGFQTKVVFLTALATDNQLLAAIARGAKGIIFKDTAPPRSVVNNGLVFGQDLPLRVQRL